MSSAASSRAESHSRHSYCQVSCTYIRCSVIQTGCPGILRQQSTFLLTDTVISLFVEVQCVKIYSDLLPEYCNIHLFN